MLKRTLYQFVAHLLAGLPLLPAIMPGNLGIVEDHFFIVTHDDQRQVCLCRSYGSRTYHDNQPELTHERWPNQSIETRDWVAHGETWPGSFGEWSGRPVDGKTGRGTTAATSQMPTPSRSASGRRTRPRPCWQRPCCQTRQRP